MANDASGYWSLANYVGQGFNVYGAYDMTSTTGLLFDFPDDTGHDFSFQGKTFQIPKTVLGAESVNTYFQHVSGSTRESYQDSLATSANVQVGIGAFSGDLKASFSSEFQTASEFAFDRYTSYSKLGTLELRVDPSNITGSLASAIAKLPATSNPGNLQLFADFFQRFGVYFIWRVVFGGSLQLYTAVNKASGLSTQDISVEAEASYGALFKAGMKVATSSRRETFNKNAFTSVNAIGGDLKLAAQLGLVDPNAPSADSVKLFVDWVGSVAASPAPVDFSLKGIWELCGDKRQAVETAWALYAQLMHPKLTIQTYGLPAPTLLPIITLGRQLKPAPAASPGPYGGWQIAILDRSNVLGDDGVKFSRHYPLPKGTDLGRRHRSGLRRDVSRHHGQRLRHTRSPDAGGELWLAEQLGPGRRLFRAAAFLRRQHPQSGVGQGLGHRQRQLFLCQLHAGGRFRLRYRHGGGFRVGQRFRQGRRTHGAQPGDAGHVLP
jgi:hypothetical protein